MAKKRNVSILKLSLLSLLAVALIFMIVVAWSYQMTRVKVLHDANEKAELNLLRARDIVDGHLHEVKVAGYGLASTIMHSTTVHAPGGDYLKFNLEGDTPGTDKEVYALIEQLVAANPHLWGAAMGFEPNVYEEYGESGFAPFVRHSDTAFEHFNLPDAGKQFRKDDWYAETKRLDRPRWSQPFTDVRGAVIACFCIPIHDANDRFIGAIAVDLQLDRFSNQLLQEIHPYEHSSVMLLDSHLVYLVNPDHDLIMKPLGKNMQEWSQEARKNKSLLYSTPVVSTDWTVAVQCQEDDIYKDVNQLTWKILKVVLAGILLIFICSGFIFYQIRKIVVRQASMESELNIASHIQLDMLPQDFPKRDNLHLSALLSPAKEVGGDLYDYFLEENTLFFAIGDVSGKGVPASLVMAITKSEIRSVVSEKLSVAEMMYRVNNHVEASNPSGMFVTLFIGKLDLETGYLEYCNAGHNPIVVVDNERHASFLETKPNLAAGLFKDFPYEMQNRQLAKGYRLILYTDGVTEAENSAKQFYGEDRLLAWAERPKNEDDDGKANSLLTDIKLFVKGNEQNDDITIMTIEI